MRWLAGVVAAVFLLAACAPGSKPPAAVGAAKPAPDWRLTAAEKTPVAGLVLVTVAIDEPEKLRALGLALQRMHGVTLEAEWPLQTIGIHCLVFRVPSGGNLEAALMRLRADKRVRTAEPMREYRTLTLHPGEDYTRLQTALDRLSVWQAQQVVTGRGVVVGLVDTGVERSHPDLSDRVALWKDFTGAGPEEPGERHGTAMAGIIIASGTDNAGITGVAPDARLMALRGCWEDEGQGRCTTFTLARAINFAIAKQVNVLNLSLTGPEDSVLRDLLEEAEARGITVVAADNGGTFPASLPAVIGVGAERQGGGAALTAPSLDILSTAPGGGYDFFTGSSVASAHVAGIAALVLEANPAASPDAVRGALTASRAPASASGKNHAAMPDACLAVQALCGGEAGQAGACAKASLCAGDNS